MPNQSKTKIVYKEKLNLQSVLMLFFSYRLDQEKPTSAWQFVSPFRIYVFASPCLLAFHSRQMISIEIWKTYLMSIVSVLLGEEFQMLSMRYKCNISSCNIRKDLKELIQLLMSPKLTYFFFIAHPFKTLELNVLRLEQ